MPKRCLAPVAAGRAPARAHRAVNLASPAGSRAAVRPALTSGIRIRAPVGNRATRHRAVRADRYHQSGSLCEPRCSESSPGTPWNPARKSSVGAGRHMRVAGNELRRSTGGQWHRSRPNPSRRPRCRSARRPARWQSSPPARAPTNLRDGYPQVFGSSTASSCTRLPGFEEGTNEPHQGTDQQADGPLRSP